MRCVGTVDRPRLGPRRNLRRRPADRPRLSGRSGTLAERYAVSTANDSLAAVRGVLRLATLASAGAQQPGPSP